MVISGWGVGLGAKSGTVSPLPLEQQATSRMFAMAKSKKKTKAKKPAKKKS
jgi:hypothetical protein